MPPALVGREAELEQIARARGRRAGGVVIEGAMGVGRSRLAREAVAAAGPRARTEWVQATRSAASIPLGAFAELAVASANTVEQRAAAVRDRADGRAIVLGVDDAHLLDAQSAELVRFLAAERVAFVIATVRAGQPVPAAIGLLVDVAERLVLEPLADGETGLLAEASIGGPIEEAARAWAIARSQGNPLYLRELLRGAVASDDLVFEGGLWRLQGSPRPSRELVELVSTRVADIGEHERRALELLALGEPLMRSEAEQLVGIDELATVERQGLVVASGPVVRIAHPLHGEALRAEMPSSRAYDAHRRLVALVRRREPFEPDDALRVARWLTEVGEPVPVDTLVDAARAAGHAGEVELAIELARSAVAAGAGFDAGLLLARTLILRDRFAEAEQELARIEDVIDSQDAAADYLDQRVTALYWGLRRTDEATALVQRARAWWPNEAWHQRLEPLGALARGLGASLEQTSALVASDDLDADVRHRLEPLHAANLFWSGRAREAYALASAIRPSIPIMTKRDGLALVVWSLVASETGEDWDGMREWTWSTFATALRSGDEGSTGIASLMIGMLRFREARFADAVRSLDEAQRHLERHDAFRLGVVVSAYRVGVALGLRDVEGAAAALARCHEALGAAGPLSIQRPYLVLAESWAARAAGDPPRAQRILLDAAGEAADGPVYAAKHAYEAMLAGAPARRLTDELSALRARCDARLVAACAEHAAALADDDGRALIACVDELEAIGARRYAILCAADAAEAFAREGRQDSARRAAARSAALLDAAQGGIAPVVAGVDAAAGVLTTRQKQLVALVARGLSNAEIAEQLGLSVRTVESHVYQAMRKLGVANRRDVTPDHGR